MKKFKKRLITGLSLGLSAITVGAIVSSCASPAVEATDPNPASANSISTNPGDPLTPEQQDYQQKLAAEIKVQFDANAKLDYSNPTDKANIDAQIAKYTKDISTGATGDLIKSISGLNLNLEQQSINFFNLVDNFYDSFNQKNLIPTEDLFEKYYETQPTPPSGRTDWKDLAGLIAFFYSNPYSIILLVQLKLKNNDNYKNLINDILFNAVIASSIISLSSISNYLNKDSASYKAEQYYDSFLQILNTNYSDFIKSLTSATPETTDTNPGN